MARRYEFCEGMNTTGSCNGPSSINVLSYKLNFEPSLLINPNHDLDGLKHDSVLMLRLRTACFIQSTSRLNYDDEASSCIIRNLPNMGYETLRFLKLSGLE